MLEQMIMRFWPLPYGNALYCQCTCYELFWLIVHTDPENALFWKTGWKRSPRVFVCTANLHTFRIDDTIATHLDLWTLWRCTTAMVDYCLCSCFFQLTHFVVECELQQQFDLFISPHKQFWFPCASHFHLLLCCFRFLRLYILHKFHVHAPSLLSPFLVNFKHHL